MTTKATILSTIRKHCLECMGGSPMEVEKCTAPNCNLYHYRFGKDPKPNKAKVELGKIAGERLKEFNLNATTEGQKSPEIE